MRSVCLSGVGVLALGLTLMACDEGKVCGPGTQDQDGTCVATAGSNTSANTSSGPQGTVSAGPPATGSASETERSASPGDDTRSGSRGASEGTTNTGGGASTSRASAGLDTFAALVARVSACHHEDVAEVIQGLLIHYGVALLNAGFTDKLDCFHALAQASDCAPFSEDSHGSLDGLEACYIAHADGSTTSASTGLAPDCWGEEAEEVEPYCEGSVIVKWTDPSCNTDCGDNTHNTQCVEREGGAPGCGIGSCSDDGQEGCEGEHLRTRCSQGILQVYDDCSPEPENTLCLINDANESACGAGVCDGDGLFACDSERRPTYCDQGVLLRMQSCALGGLDCVAQNGPSGESGAGCGQGYSACTAHSCGEGAMSYCAPSGVHTEVPCTLLDPRLTSCAIVELNADDWGLDFSDSSSPGDSEDWMEADDDEEVPVCAASAEARECAEGDAFCDGDVAHVCVGGLDYAVDCGALEGAGCVQEAGKVSCEGLHTSSAAENTAGDAASPEPRFGADG